MRNTFSKIMLLFLHVNFLRKGDFYAFIFKRCCMYLFPKVNIETRFRETDGLEIANYIVLLCYFFLSLRLIGGKFMKITPSHQCSPKMSLNSQRNDSVDHLCRATHSLVEISSRVTVQCENADIL